MLTTNQQETATLLGYDQDTWDEWSDLSPKQQELWGVLDWTAENWATGDGVETENLSWHALSQAQRDAAEELGLAQDTWDEWSDLPLEKQEQWGVLGWSKDNWSSNVGGVESESLEWGALSAEQLAAAQALGFARDTWDSWSDLSPKLQELWGVLGWTAGNWATGDGVEAEAMSWSALTQAQRDAAEELGFSQDAWDEWSDLPAEKQELWNVLGWTAENWSTGEGVKTEKLSWEELSAEQRTAAELLGFPHDAWDENWAEW